MNEAEQGKRQNNIWADIIEIDA